jgi:transposase InsO family protein
MTGLSVSGYYYRPKRDPVERAKRDADLREKIDTIQAEHPRYGYRRVMWELRRSGQRINSKRIRRVMREHGLFAEVKKAYVNTTDSDHGFGVYSNLVKGRELDGLNQIWVADITYIRISTCFVFLAVILDLFSRKVIGWALSQSLQHDLSLEALKMAIEQRKPSDGCIHHSDRGVQYACDEYVQLLTANGFQISMSRSGNPYDNAYAESFMKTLKHEEVSLWEYETMADVVERVPYFIEEVYNKKRLHSSIGYMPPEEYERLMIEKSTNMACNPSPQL